MKRKDLLAGLVLFLSAAMPFTAGAKEVTNINSQWGFKAVALIPWGVYPHVRVPECDTIVNLPNTWNEKDFMSDKGFRKGEGSYEKKSLYSDGKPPEKRQHHAAFAAVYAAAAAKRLRM